MEVPYPTTRPKNEGHPLTQNSNPPPLEYIPSAPARQGTPWPNAGSASENLFETRKDWPIPPTPVPTPAPTIKTEAPPQVAVILHAMMRHKQAAEGCSWGPCCPICKNEEEHKEDWDGNNQREQPRMHPKDPALPAAKCSAIPAPECIASPVTTYTAPPATEQIKLRKEWEERIERLNEKIYNYRLLF